MLEIISLVGGGVFGSFFKMWTQSSRDKHERQLVAMKISEQNAKFIQQARNNDDRGFSWTRRIIALSCIFSIVVLPKLAAIFLPETGIWVSSEILQSGFLFFSEDQTITQWQRLQGFVITPIDTFLASAVAGIYFGASVVKR